MLESAPDPESSRLKSGAQPSPRFYERPSPEGRSAREAAVDYVFSSLERVQSEPFRANVERLPQETPQAFRVRSSPRSWTRGRENSHLASAALLLQLEADPQGSGRDKANSPRSPKPDDNRQIELLKALIASGDVAASNGRVSFLTGRALQEQVLFLMSRIDRPGGAASSVSRGIALGPGAAEGDRSAHQRALGPGRAAGSRSSSKQSARKTLNLNQLRTRQDVQG